MELTIVGWVRPNRDGHLCLPYGALQQHDVLLTASDLSGATDLGDGVTVPHLLQRFSDRNQSLWIYRRLIVRSKASGAGIYEPVTPEEQQLEIMAQLRKREAYFAGLRASAERALSGQPDETTREPVPESVRIFVWQRDQGRCVRCGTRKLLEFDHIIPVAQGGATTERNIQLLCEPCNRSKGDRI